MVGREKALGGGVVQKGEQGVEIACDVEKAARFRMQVELAPGEDFEQFVERAESSRQSDEGVGEIEHGFFSRVHRGSDDHTREARVLDIFSAEGLWDHAPDFSPGREDAFGRLIH